MDDGPILFYGHRNEWGEFSNFYTAPFDLDGRFWPTVEHWFVAGKSGDSPWSNKVLHCGGPAQAKRLGREVKLRPDWDRVKVTIMERGVLAKFEQNPRLKELLLSTGDRPLHENCSDPWWGGGPNYPRGRDLLGKVLTRVRITLRNEAK